MAAGELVCGAWRTSRLEHFLTTADLRHFEGVPELRVEDWLADYR